MGIDAMMLVKIQNKEDWLSEREVIKLAYELGDRFGHDSFCRYGGCHNASIVKVYMQDGDDITPKEGEQFIEINLSGRYYGPGYERGDIICILAIAEFVEIRTGGTIYYGGDSSGVCAEPFNEEARQKMWEHFVDFGHQPYRSGFHENGAAPLCEMCNEKMSDCGGGGWFSFVHCSGCGKRKIVTKEKEFTLSDSDNFFAASEKLKSEGLI